MMPVPFERLHAREETIEELFHKDWYTAEEIGELLGVSPITVRQAARHGELRARIIDHHVYGASREDVIAWLRARVSP
jgi:hypothetical protein